MSLPATFVVTDIEADGMSPERNSMLSFACVAVTALGEIVGEFEAVLTPRPTHAADPDTTAFWQGIPDAYAAATTNPEPPEVVMPRFCDWVDALPGTKIFAARPLAFDGRWIDHYLHCFAQTRIFGGPHAGRKIFQADAALDIDSYMAGLLGQPGISPKKVQLSKEWLGDHPHTHRAIDDARGYASVLQHLLALARSRT